MNRLPYLALLSLLLLPAGPARAGVLVNVDFNISDSRFGGLFSPTYSGAAVLGSAGDVWNGIGGAFNTPASGGPLSLVSSAGDPSGVSLSYAGGNGFFEASSNFNNTIFRNSPYGDLMRDYLLTTSTATVNLSGLTPGAGYELILYSAANDTDRETIFTLDGTSASVIPDSNATLTEGKTFARFSGTVAQDGKLGFSFRPGQAGRFTNAEGDLDGLQIRLFEPSVAAVPEPSSLATLTAGCVGLAVWRRLRASFRS